jgi:hypothetical protein
MDDTLLMEAYAELRALLANPTVPEGVVSACRRLSECQIKLFCTVPEGLGAGNRTKAVDDSRTFDLDSGGLRLEPSNFLRELLTALRAFEWSKVLVLVHGATSSAELSPSYGHPIGRLSDGLTIC